MINLLLMAMTVIWGTSFPITKMGLSSGLGTSMLLTLWFFSAFLILLLAFHKRLKKITAADLSPSIACGVLMFLGYWLQVEGQKYTTPSISAFITSSYVVFVPFTVWLIEKKRPDSKVFLLSFLVFVGVVVMTPFDGQSGSLLGSLISLFGAIGMSLHIVYIGRVAQKVSPEILTTVQMLTVSVISMAACMLFGEWRLVQIDYKTAAFSTLYLGLFCTAICLFGQSYAQKRARPETAAIIFSMEGLFGFIFSIILKMETFSINMLVGGIIILLAAVLINIVQFQDEVRQKECKLLE